MPASAVYDPWQCTSLVYLSTLWPYVGLGFALGRECLFGRSLKQMFENRIFYFAGMQWYTFLSYRDIQGTFLHYQALNLHSHTRNVLHWCECLVHKLCQNSLWRLCVGLCYRSTWLHHTWKIVLRPCAVLKCRINLPNAHGVKEFCPFQRFYFNGHGVLRMDQRSATQT